MKFLFLFEAFYIIFMYNFFKTTYYIHHPLEILIQRINPYLWLEHSIMEEDYSNKICPFGNLMGFVLGFWIIFVTYYPSNLVLQFNKVVWATTAIVSLITNMNAFIYVLPCLIIELIRYSILK